MSERLDRNNRLLARKLVHVALPIALQGLIGSSLNFVDNLMVGSLGESPLAATGVGLQLYFIYWMILFGFSSGCSTYMAQLYGAGDIVRIKKTTGFAIGVGFLTGVLFFFITILKPHFVLSLFTDIEEIKSLGSQYIVVGAPVFLLLGITVPLSTALRATQQSKIPMLISIGGFGANTFLNYCLIFGNLSFPAMGVKGAALATVISRTIEVSLMIGMTLVRKNCLQGKLRDYFKWESLLALKVTKNSIPTTVNETMWALGTAAYAAIYARMGVTEYAAFQAGSAINSMFTLAAFSVGDAILILVGQKLGEGRLEEGYMLAKKLLRFSIVIGIIGGLGLFVTSPILVEFFNFTAAGNETAIAIMRIFAATMAPVVYNACIITGVLRCGGDTNFAMISETLTVWLIGVPLAAAGSMLWGLEIYWVVLFSKVEEVIKCIILTCRTDSKKWVKNVVKDFS